LPLAPDLRTHSFVEIRPAASGPTCAHVSAHHFMQAYRSLAKKHHPDRGGTAVEFAQVQHAFEVLSDPRQREVYDTWAKEVQFRYVRSNPSQVSYGVVVLATCAACACQFQTDRLCISQHAKQKRVLCPDINCMCISCRQQVMKIFCLMSLRDLGCTVTHRRSLW